MDAYTYMIGAYAAKRCTADPGWRDDPLKSNRHLIPKGHNDRRRPSGCKQPEGFTLEAIAGEFGLSRERIRCIEDKALRKLREALKERGIEKDLL